jgi:cytochrome P450
MTQPPLPSLLQLTPLDPTYRDDPHKVLDDLRSRCPVYHDSMSGNFVLSRYADVRAVVSDLDLLRDPVNAEEGAILQRRALEAIDPNVPRSSISSILTLDDPDHARIRRPLAQALYARVARFKPQVELIIDGILDGLEGETGFDLMDRFCVPVPIDVIASILGVDRERLVQFREWSEGLIQGLNPFRNAEQTAAM